MPKIKYETFTGISPRFDKRSIQDSAAQVSENCDLLSGKIRPYKEPLSVYTLPASDRQTIYPYPDTTEFLSFTGDVDVVKSPLTEDQFQRIYYTGDGVPKVRGIDTELTTGTQGIEYDLGLPQPTLTPIVNLVEKTDADWAREWGYFWEEPDGEQLENGTLREDGIEVQTVTEGEAYILEARNTLYPDDITAANPCVVSFTGVHDLINGQRIALRDLGGMDDLTDKIYQINVLDANSFSLEDESGNDIDSTDFTPYTSGGTCHSLGIPPRFEASTDANLIIFFDAFDPDGNTIGRVYPLLTNDSNFSAYTGNNNFSYNGKPGSAEQENFEYDPVGQGHINPNSITYDITLAATAIESLITERSYVYTFVSKWGEESQPSNPSAVIAIGADQSANLTNHDTVIVGNYNVTKKRFYRTVTGASGASSFQFVGEVDVGETTFLDNKNDNQTGEELLTELWIQPDADLKGIVMMPGGFAAAFKENEVYFSEPYQIHAWPAAYVISVDYNIVAMGVSGNTLVVTTEGFPFALTGITPLNITSSRIHINQACVSKRGLTDVGSTIIYPSPDGLVVVQGSSAKLATENRYTRKEWEDILPSTMIADSYNRNLYMKTDNTFLVFDLDERGVALGTITETAAGMISDPLLDNLYLIQGDQVVEWNAGADNLTCRFKGKDFTLPRPIGWSVGRVIADAYPVTLKLYAEDTLVLTYSVLDDEAFRLPNLRPEKHWEIEVEKDEGIDEVLISTNMSQL